MEYAPPVLQGGDDLDQPVAAPVYQNAPVQPGGAVSIPRQRALQRLFSSPWFFIQL